MMLPGNPIEAPFELRKGAALLAHLVKPIDMSALQKMMADWSKGAAAR